MKQGGEGAEPLDSAPSSFAYSLLVADAKLKKLRLGGMALRNGLLVHGPTHWAAAVRRPDGSIEVGSERKPELVPGLVAKAPGLRGPVKLAEAMLVLPLVRKRMRSARLPFEDGRVIGATAATLALSSLLRRSRPATAGRETVLQAIGVVPALVALSDRDLAAYHGAEHKAIAAYEQGVDDVAAVPKEHDRCGSNLIVPMMMMSAAGTIALERLADKPSSAARALVGLAGASAAVEAFAWSDRHHREPLAEAFHTPGGETQRLWAPKDPSSAQLEVSLAAMAEITGVEPAPGERATSPPPRRRKDRPHRGARRRARRRERSLRGELGDGARAP